MNDYLNEKIVKENILGFRKADNKNAHIVQDALQLWDKEKGEFEGNFLEWLKTLDLRYKTSFQSFLFYLWTKENKINVKMFEDTYYFLTPTISKSWSKRIVVASGSDEPNIEGGFLKNEFSIFNYEFSPVSHGLLVTHTETDFEGKDSLDTILDFLSFLVTVHGEDFLGFRQIPSSKWTSSGTTVMQGSFGPEVKIALPNYNFRDIEKAIARIEKYENQDGLLSRLLHVRHRVILENNLESKLISLWGFLEDLWPIEIKSKKLLTKNERKIIGKEFKTLNIPQEKIIKMIEILPHLKENPRSISEHIAKNIGKLDCSKGWDIEKIERIYRFRCKFAHGEQLFLADEQEVIDGISLLFNILNELIRKEFELIGIDIPKE